MNYLDFLRTKIVSAPKSGTSVSADEISPVLKPHQRDAVKWALDLECKEKFFKDPQKLANALRRNYGFAGREFVERIQDEGIKRAEKFYNEFYSKLIDGDTTEKQAMAGAAVLTADALVTEWIFEDDRAPTVKDIEPFLQYLLGGVKDITSETVYGKGHFAVTIFDTRVFVADYFEYVKDSDTGKVYVENGKWKDE